MFVDTHCHLDDTAYESNLDGVMAEFETEKLAYAITMGCDLRSSARGKSVAEKYERAYYGVGIHPENAGCFNADCAEKLIKLSKSAKCAAFGEIGLDYHYDGYDAKKQKICFSEQLAIAFALRLPVSIHSRDAVCDTLKILSENRRYLVHGGVMHCFSGSTEVAKQYMDMGLYISFGGTLTFRNAIKAAEAARYAPLDMCLTETDSPYLSPVPYRGSTNYPARVKFVTEKLAEIKKLPVETVAERIKNNSDKLFSIGEKNG